MGILEKALGDSKFSKEIQRDKIGLFGGSHGGTICMTLAGHPKYNSYFKA